MEENIEQNIENTERGFKKLLKKRLVVVGVVVLAVIVVLIVGFFALNNFIYNEKQAENNGESLVDNNPVVYFNPQELNLSSGEIQIPIVRIMGDLPNPADTIKIDIEYDTLTISDVQISQIAEGLSILGDDAQVVTNTPNYQPGRAFFEIQTPRPVTGTGPIALLTFKPNPASPVTTTTVSLTTLTSVSNSVTNTNYPTASMRLNITLPSNSTDRSNLAPDAQERLLEQQQLLQQ